MKRLLKIISVRGEFTKNALILTVGTGIAQFFPILFYPILGRIFTPVDFGILATLASITSILSVLSTGKYESSILIAETKQNAANIVGLVILISFLFLSVSLIFFQLFSNQISLWFNEPSLKAFLFIPPLSAFSIVIYNCYNEWCVRNKYFITLSWNKIINSSATTLSKLLLGIVKIASNGLIIGDLIGRMISAIGCVLRVLKKDKAVFLQISFKNMMILAKKHIEFPKYQLPDQLLSKIGGILPVLFIGAYFKSVEVGFYAMTMNILSVPLSTIGLAVRDVFRQRANEDYIINGNCFKVYIRLLKVISLSGLIGFLCLIFILPNLFSFVLGEQWLIAGQYSQILLPMITLSFISMSLSGVLIITNKMKISMYWQIYYVLSTVISLFIGFFFFRSIKMVLICFVIGRCSAYILYILLSYRFSKGNMVDSNMVKF